MSAVARAVDWLAFAAAVFAGFLLLAAVLVVTQMVVIRYALNASTVWQTEFVIYAVTAATFLGSAYVLKRRGHVGVDLLPQALSGTPRLIVDGLAGLAGLVFTGLLAYSGWLYFHEAWAYDWTTGTVWNLPLWIPLLPLPLGVGLLVAQYVVELWRLVADGQPLSAGESAAEAFAAEDAAGIAHDEPGKKP